MSGWICRGVAGELVKCIKIISKHLDKQARIGRDEWGEGREVVDEKWRIEESWIGDGVGVKEIVRDWGDVTAPFPHPTHRTHAMNGRMNKY